MAGSCAVQLCCVGLLHLVLLFSIQMVNADEVPPKALYKHTFKVSWYSRWNFTYPPHEAATFCSIGSPDFNPVTHPDEYPWAIVSRELWLNTAPFTSNCGAIIDICNDNTGDITPDGHYICLPGAQTVQAVLWGWYEEYKRVPQCVGGPGGDLSGPDCMDMVVSNGLAKTMGWDQHSYYISQPVQGPYKNSSYVPPL